MGRIRLVERVKHLYDTVLAHKLVTICVLFTIVTIIDSVMIVAGFYPPKVGINPYIHLLARLALNSVVVGAIYLRHILKKRIRNGAIVFVLTYVLTLGLVLAYVWMNSLFIDLHPDGYIDMSISYTFMYLLFGLLFLIGRAIQRRIGKKEERT